MSLSPKQRLDQWLFFARFFKSRTLAGKECGKKRLRIDGERIKKPNQQITASNIIEFKKGREDFIVRILALGKRRGPAPEAQLLYEDLKPKPPSENGGGNTNDLSPFKRERGSGRPTKAERRAMDKLRGV